MKIPFHHTPGLAAILLLLMIGCKSGPSDEQVAAADTRIKVKMVFDSCDLQNTRFIFNLRRAEVIRKQMEAEQDPVIRLKMGNAFASELLRAGETAGAIQVHTDIYKYITQNKMVLDSASKRDFLSELGICYMRQGEIENCVKNHNHQSCFIPIAGDGIHQLESGSRNAIKQYELLLNEFPKDLETRYLLNLAYMTLGEYPDKVPARFRIDPSWFSNKVKIQPFTDIAPRLGLNRRTHAGGTVVDDFNNDGWLDIMATSQNPAEGLLFYMNNGDGTFTDQTKAWRLDGQVGSLNLNHTDYNNDGWLDLYLMRGGWHQVAGDIPSTLLMNTGKGYFEDVTMKSGLTRVAASQNSAWADFNLDGWVDLVAGNESFGEYERGIDFYLNQQDGTFKRESLEYGLDFKNQFIKGCVATDVNNDRYPDIYFSGITGGNYLFINKIAEGKGFVEVGQQLKVHKPIQSFPCFNFDFDNDGNEDLFVSAFINDGTPAKHWMQSHTGLTDPALLPRLYQNKGNMDFEEVGAKLGLTEVVFTMGCNFGDINTDGFLDFYLGTGNPLYQSIVPNKMYLNMEGQRFEDVSYSGGFANIQKGHGVGFGDLDHDGDEDIYIVIGGAYDGDNFFNCLFENPNDQKNNWVVLNLKGKTCNRSAIGARVALSVQENGTERKIYRTVTTGASFGGNSLALEVGLRKATSINSVTVQWPCKDCPDQVFTGFSINQAYKLIQDSDSPKAMEYTQIRFGNSGTHHEHSHH